jgi:8-oxo-dGTP diphosphatase
VTIHGPADGWVESPDGRRFWGRAGAAGLLALDAADRVLLQHRVEWSHFGGTWGLPGGARDFGETAVAGALREAVEEAAVPADALRIRSQSVLDLGFWSYTTVVAAVTRPFEPVISDAESLELRWVPRAELDVLPLHPGLAASWPGLRAQLDLDVHLVVDAANVVGSRPDGWWRGLPADLLFDAPSDGPGAATSWWPTTTVVLEGQAKDAADVDGLVVRRAAGEGDDAIVAEVEHRIGSAGAAGAVTPRVVVATADRGLADRVRAAGAGVVGPRRLLDLLG